MFTVYADENLLFDTSQEDYERILLEPRISLEANKPGQFAFIMPPGHALYDGIERMKTTITLFQDGEELFRGRVIDEETDTFNQKHVNCEGELAFFIDSIVRPYEYDGTPYGLFEMLINNHNEMVNENQRFTIGNVTAISNEGTAQVDTDEYADTLSELNSRMINAYGGYFIIRNVDGVRYIDYLADGDENEQPIEFGVNLLDLKKRISANDMFNVLIPKGTMLKGDNGRFTEALNIKEVNNGLDYIEDTAAIEQYGRRIWKTKQWNYIEDAQTLLEKAREYLAIGVLEETTLTIGAVDMHFVDKEKQRIGICNRVRILSEPHGLNRLDVCRKLEGELLNPEQFQYTFGKPQMSLIDNVVLEQKKYGGGGGGKSVKDDVEELKRWAWIYPSMNDATIDLLTGQIGEVETNANIQLNGVKASIDLKVNKDDVISAINLSPEAVLIQSGKINLEGYVTASELAALSAEITNLTAGYTTAGWIRAQNLDASIMADLKAMRLNGSAVSQKNITMGSITSAGKALSTGDDLDLSHSHKVIVNDDGTVTLGEVSAEGGNFKIADTKVYKDGVSAAYAEGWAAAVAMCAVELTGTYKNVITVKMPSETVDTAAEDDVYTVSSDGDLGAIVNRAPNVYSVNGNAYAYIKHNDEKRENVSTTPLYRSTTFS